MRENLPMMRFPNLFACYITDRTSRSSLLCRCALSDGQCRFGTCLTNINHHQSQTGDCCILTTTTMRLATGQSDAHATYPIAAIYIDAPAGTRLTRVSRLLRRSKKALFRPSPEPDPCCRRPMSPPSIKLASTKSTRLPDSIVLLSCAGHERHPCCYRHRSGLIAIGHKNATL